MGEICFWLTADIRLSERNKGRADAHVRIYISQRCRFQMHVSPFVFPAAAKESRWHAARPRGRNPSPRERKRRTHTFQRTRSIVFITVTLISPALILQTVTRGLRVVLVLTSLPPAEIAVMRYTRRNGPVPTTAERHRASPQVKRWGGATGGLKLLIKQFHLSSPNSGFPAAARICSRVADVCVTEWDHRGRGFLIGRMRLQRCDECSLKAAYLCNRFAYKPTLPEGHMPARV